MRWLRRNPTVVLNGLTVVTIALVIASSWFGSNRFNRAQVWSEVVQDMQTDVYESHLSLVERLGGDEEVEVQSEVLAPLDDAIGNCEILRDGGRVGELEIDRLSALGPGEEHGDLCRSLTDFGVLTAERLTGDAEDEEGTSEDLEFDAAFDDLADDLDELDSDVNASRRDDEGTVRNLSYGVGAALLLLLAGIVVVGRRYGQSLAALAQRNQIVLDAAADGIYGVERSGAGAFANPAVVELTGRSQDELADIDLHTLFHGAADPESAHPADECPVMANLTSDSGRTVEDVFWRSDGTSYPAEYTASRVDDPSASTDGVIVFRDISERRAVETMKSQFVSLVSHELRTPLTSIHGSLGLLAGGALGEMPASAQRMLEIATTNTDRLVRLINDILDIERMESGAIRMQREVIDTADVIDQAVSAVRSMATQAGVELVASTEPVMVWADHDRMTQVLVNLISNAVKFSGSDSTVEVTVSMVDDDAVFAVRDHGRGIPEDKLEAIFGRFQQVDASDAREKGGTGLGLAISESIVNQHDGRIWVESVLGEGSTFFVRLPTVRRGRSEAKSAPGDGPVVLVVDDDDSVLEVVCTILGQRGYRAVPASSGEEAIAKAVAEPPDAVVLDLIMPGTGGWDVLHALRERPQTADIPVVILSILTERDEAPTPESYQNWVTKPFESESLTSALKQAMRSRTGPPTAVIIEDDADLADVLTASFERHGIAATAALTVDAARRIVPEVDPDLVVLDLHLPDGSGADVLHELRSKGYLRGTPVVVYTGQDIEADERSQLDRDGAIVFTKTRVTPEEFERQVLELVGALVPTDLR